MPVQPTPPIQLDPSMEIGHQLAFTNQNLNNIASVIGQNSFVILQSGIVSVTAAANVTNTTTVAHNLGLIPIPLAFLSNGIQYYPLPTWTNLSRDDVNHVINFRTWLDAYCDSTNLSIQFFNSTAATTGPYDIKYYLLQQTAN